MKNCPYCKAKIEDDARFCLYCMRPLIEKEIIAPRVRRSHSWMIAVAIAVLLLAAAILLHTFMRSTPENPSLNVPQETSVPAVRPSVSTPPETEPPVTEPPVTEPPITEPPITEPPASNPPVSSAVYTYRLAVSTDDYYALYQNPGSDIVITGIATPSPDGIYDIPAYIDGKRVLTIGYGAFSNSNATVVYVPETVKNIAVLAFAPCDLTDLYLRGSSIHIDNNAFSGSFTIHCSDTCNDRNFRLIKNIADVYGAVWEEWGGD